jgi:reactive intermediate/imine deaminase
MYNALCVTNSQSCLTKYNVGNIMKTIISTDNAPSAIGTYSQAVKVNNTVYLSGQIPLIPETMTVISDDFTEQTHQVFKNLVAVCEAAGGNINDMVKVNIFMMDLANFATVNEVMSQYFAQPYPARAAVQVSRLPKDVSIEIDGVMELPNVG